MLCKLCLNKERLMLKGPSYSKYKLLIFFFFLPRLSLKCSIFLKGSMPLHLWNFDVISFLTVHSIGLRLAMTLAKKKKKKKNLTYSNAKLSFFCPVPPLDNNELAEKEEKKIIIRMQTKCFLACCHFGRLFLRYCCFPFQ